MMIIMTAIAESNGILFSLTLTYQHHRLYTSMINNDSEKKRT